VVFIALLGSGCGTVPPPNPPDRSVAGKPAPEPPRWTLKFSNAIKPAGADKGMVYVSIEKVEKGVGKVQAKHIHFDGDRIGWWEEIPGADPTPLHRVTRADGKAVPAVVVDFDTGMTLTSVVPVRRPVLLRRCKPIFNAPNGEKVACTVIEEIRQFDQHEISYRDGRDSYRVQVPDPALLHQLCPMHQQNFSEPAKEPRLEEARRLLDEADRSWDVDSARSIKLYQRLLQDYKDIVIRLQVRNKVEGRARQADE